LRREPQAADPLETRRRFRAGTRLHECMTWLAAHGGPRSKTYEELWRWSVSDLEAFWTPA